MTGRVRAAAGILLSILLLAWALRDVSATEVVSRIRGVEPLQFTLAIAIALSSMWIRAFRWGLLLRPVAGSAPFRPRLAATFIGFTVNNLLPARVGEFARAFSVAKLAGVTVPAAVATLVIERLLDGIVLVVLLFAVMASPGFPAAGEIGGVDFRSAALVVALSMAALGAGLGVLVAAPQLAERAARSGTRFLPGRVREPVLGIFLSFARGLTVLRSPALFAASVGLAFFQWTFVALSFLYAFRAFEIEQVPFAGAIFLQSLVSLAAAVPSSPGFFGPFEAAAREGLALWGVPGQHAISFAIGFHIGGFIPVTLIGIYYVWRLGLGWSAVTHSEETVEDELAHTDLTDETRPLTSDA